MSENEKKSCGCSGNCNDKSAKTADCNDKPAKTAGGSVGQWIMSLAVSITLCALFFAIVAAPAVGRLNRTVDKLDLYLSASMPAALQAVPAQTKK